MDGMLRRAVVLVAVLAVVGCGFGALASSLGGLIVGLEHCHNLWIEQSNAVDRTYGPGTGHSTRTYLNKMEEVNQAADDCVDAVLDRYHSFGFPHLHGEPSFPDAVVYHFENEFEPGEAVYLTVYNGTEEVGRFSQAEIRLNGEVVAGPGDFTGAAYFDREVELLPGTNELRIGVDPSEDGNVMVFLSHERLSPPN